MRKSASKSVFKADKVSGAEATVFMLSPVLEVIYNSNFLYKFNFPFYALSWDKNIYHTDEWIDENRYEAAALALLRNGQKNGFAQFLKIEAKIKKEVLNFRRYGLEVSEQLADCSNEELVRHYNEFMDEYVRIFGLGAITFLYESTLSEKLSKSIAGRYANATEIISQLVQTKYTSFMIAAEADLVKIKNTKTARDRKKLMQQFLKRFYFIRASYAYSPSLEARYVAADAKKARLAARRRTPVAATLTRQEKAIITLLKITEVIRDQRKIASLVGPYVMSRFIDEAVTRLRVSRGDIDRMFWFEYGELVSEPHALLKKIRNRKSASVVFDGNRKYYLEYNALRPRAIHLKNQKEVWGTPASAGVARGNVCIVLGPKMFSKFKKGNILVAQMTRPDFVPIMRNAAAFVTDEGGLTSHAAIVAREMGKPCVVGAKIATEVFKDGDRVEVDANKGLVRRLN